MKEVSLGFNEHPDGTNNATPLKQSLIQRVGSLLGRTDKTKPAPTPDVVFARREFTEETGTMNTENVRFDENMQLQYRTYLENHLTELVRVRKENPTSILFSSNEYRHHVALMERLCGGDSRTGFTVDSAKITEALKKDKDLWIVATQMMEEDIALTTWGMGQLAAVDPGRFNKAQGVFDAKPENGGVKLNINQGVVNRIFNGVKDKHVNKALGVGLIGASTFFGFTLAGPAGAIAGAKLSASAVAGIGAVKMGFDSLRKNGVSIRTDSRPELMAAMKDPQFSPEATYLKEVLGFSVDDFNVKNQRTWLGQVKPRIERNAEAPESMDISKVEQDLLSKMITRYNFYTSEKGLNIPPNKVNMIPENIYFATQKTSGVRTVWEKEMQNERNILTSIFAVDYGRAPNRAERLLIDQQARKNTIMVHLEKSLAKNLDENHKTITMLNSREAAYAKSKGEGVVGEGRALTKLTEELKAEKTAIEAINGVLATEQVTLTTFSEKHEAFRKAQEAAKKAFGTSELAALKKIKKQREKVDDTRLDTLIQQLSDAETAMETARVYGEAFDSSFGTASAELTLLTSIDGLLAAAPPPAIAGVGLSLPDIASLPMSEIMRRVNVAYESARNHVPPIVLPGAWSSEQNLDLSKREQILYIIADARARTVEPLIATPGAGFTTFTNAIGGGGYNLNENFIRSATVAEIIAEVNRNTGLATLDAGNPAHVTQIQVVMDVVSRRYIARRDKLQGVLAQEPTQRDQYNNRVVATRSTIEAQIQRLEASVPNLSQGEASLARFRNISQISSDYVGEHFVDYSDSLNLIAGMHAHCTGLVGYAGELDLATLHTKSLTDILSAIHLADTLGSANAWPPAMDGDDDHVRSIISAYTEAKAVAKLGPLLTDNVDLNDLVATHGLTYDQVRTLTDPQIVDLVNAAGGGWTKNAAHYARIKNARTQVVQRFDARKNELSKAIQTARVAGGPLARLSDADLAFLETNDEYTHLRSAVVMRQTLQAQKDGLIELGDLSNSISGIQTNLSTYDTARTSLQNKRREIRHVFDGIDKTETELEAEKKIREDHPTTELDIVISSVETTKEALKPTATEAQAAKKVTDEISDNYATIVDIDVRLVVAGRGAVGLDRVTLSTLSYPEICRKINDAYVASLVPPPLVPPVGWPKERNTEKTNQDMVGHAIAKALSQSKKIGVMAGLPGPITALYLTTSAFFSEAEPLSLDTSEFIAEAVERARVGGIVIAITQLEGEELLKTYAKVHQTYGDAEKELQTRNTTRGEDITYETTHIAESLEDRRQFIAHTRELAKNQGTIFARIPDFITQVVGDADFAAPISAVDPTFSGSEKAPTPRGGALLANTPKGYYEILNFMFDYYDKDGRGDAFQKILNVEQFRPDRLAQSFADHLNLSWAIPTAPPYTIQETCAALQTMLQQKRLTGSDIYWGMKEMMDEYIAEIVPM